MKGIYILPVFLVVTFTSVLSADDYPVFKRIIRDYISVKSVKAVITQHVYAENGTAEIFTGDYYADSGGNIRIDYLKPERQIVIVNKSGLYWYYPERMLLFQSEKKGGDSVSVPVLMSMISEEYLRKLSVKREGFRFYSLFKTAEVYTIVSDGGRTKIRLWIDPVADLIRKRVILDDSGRELVKEEFTDYTVINGISIPSGIELTARTEQGVIHTVTEYGSIIINSSLDKDLFEFRVTPRMQVRKLK